MEDPYFPWNLEDAKAGLKLAFDENSEHQLLRTLRQNSFLFADLFTRQGGVQPIFHEVSIGGKYTCDFAWLNDNSDGPEWVLVEVEKPYIPLFRSDGYTTAEFNRALGQTMNWERYFAEYPAERTRIFGAVARFRYVLVAGNEVDWSTDHAQSWRKQHNSTRQPEVRSNHVFERALRRFHEHPDQFWSFAENPSSRAPSELEAYWKGYSYMDDFRKWSNA